MAAPVLPSNVITFPLTRALSPQGTFARTMNGFEHDHYNGIVRLLQQIVRDPEDREDRLYRFVNVASMVASGQDKGLQLLMGVLAK